MIIWLAAGPSVFKWDRKCWWPTIIKSWVSFLLPLAMCHLSLPSKIIDALLSLLFAYALLYQFFNACRYILSRHRKVVWDVNIFNIIINVPWRDATSDPHNLVISLINKISSISDTFIYFLFCFVTSDHEVHNLLTHENSRNINYKIMG